MLDNLYIFLAKRVTSSKQSLFSAPFLKTASLYDLLLLFPKTLSFSGALFGAVRNEKKTSCSLVFCGAADRICKERSDGIAIVRLRRNRVTDTVA